MIKLRPFLSLLGLTLALLPAVRAQPQKPDMLGAMVAADTVDELTKKIRAKVEKGALTAEAFAPELKELDENIATFADNKEFAAQFAFMKALLYVQVLDDLPRARQLLEALQRDYPDTEFATNAGQILPKVEEAIARDAATPELRPLIAKIRTKIQAGARTEAAFADELAKLDALIARYSGKPESAATVIMTKVMLHAQALAQPAKSRELLVALAKKYPDTEAARAVPQLLAQLDAAAATGK